MTKVVKLTPRCAVPVIDARKRATPCRKPATTTRTIEGVEVYFCEEHAAHFDKSPPKLDRAELRAAAASLRTAWNDADGVALDMLRPPRARQLGPALHAKNYTEAREGVEHALNHLLTLLGGEPPPDDSEPSDPAGAGSSPAY